jgi:hypothetical protein
MKGRRAPAFVTLGMFSASIAFGQGAESLASRDATGLLGSPRELAFDVSRVRAADEKDWIRLSSVFECAYRAGIESVIATLWDFRSAPKVFSRIEAVRIRSDTGACAVIEQRTGIRILGLSYLSNLTFRETLSRTGPRSATLGFESIEVDDTTLSSRGSWTLEEAGDASGSVTCVRYEAETCVAPAFPGQEWIMRRFGERDFRKVMLEVGEATDRRIKRG